MTSVESEGNIGPVWQGMEKKVEDAKAEAATLEAQHAELQRQCEAVEASCEELRQAQERDAAAIVRLDEQRCQVGRIWPCSAAVCWRISTKQALFFEEGPLVILYQCYNAIAAICVAEVSASERLKVA